METVTETIVLERSATFAPVKSRLQFGRRRLAVAGLALAVTLGGIGYGRYWWNIGRFIESTDDAYAGGNVTAGLAACRGLCFANPGDRQPVCACRSIADPPGPRDFQAALDHAQAIADQRQAALSGLEAKYVLQQAMISQAEADLNAKAAHATFADADAVRYRNLAATTLARGKTPRGRQRPTRRRRSTTKSAQAGLAAARQQLTVLDAQIAEARADVAQAKADLETARLNLGYTEIRSPIDGYVGNRAAQVGAYVANGAYLLSVIPSQGLWVDANFKEDQLAHMRPGQPATVVADVLPGKIFHGHVESLAPGTGAVFSVIPPENATGNFTKIVQRVPVRIALDDGEARPRRVAAGSVDDSQRRHALRRTVRGVTAMPAPTGLAAQPAAVRGDVFRRVHGAARHPDRRLVTAGHRRRPVGGAGRDQLGADRLSDRRDRRDPAQRLADPGVLDALAVRRLGRRLYRHQPALRPRLEHPEHDRLPGAAGLLGASMIPTMFTSSFHFFQGPRRVYSAAVVGTIASIAPMLGPVIGGWITDTLELALAVLRQPRCRASRSRSSSRCSSGSTNRIGGC